MDPSSSSNSNLDKAFETLTIASNIEKRVGPSKLSKELNDSARKYLEACSLLKKHVKILQTQASSDLELNSHKGKTKSQTKIDSKIKLLTEKIQYYTNHANNLMQKVNANSTSTTKASEIKEISTETSDILQRANFKLSIALDLDEEGKKVQATEAYMAAADMFLRGYKITKNNGEKDLEETYKRRLQAALDRAEELKKSLASKSNVNPKVKHPSVKKAETKSPKNALSPSEIEVLKQSSLISSGLFMPWSDDEIKTFPFFREKLWTDPKGMLKLSSSQQKHFYKWARPSEIVQMRGPSYGKQIKMVHEITPYSIRQKYVTDCSFIASLVICAAFERRLKRKLITTIIYPQDKNGNPIFNPSGRYLVRLWLNGVARSVPVDDLFPVDKFGNILCSHTNCKSAFELWVCIIEKAYMKLCGGYDFPGSNSGIDLFALTGWIPEQIYFPTNASEILDHETAPDRAWKRLLSAHSYGDCLITVACSDTLSEEKAKQVGLITGHAYAVLRVVACKNGEKLLQVKNPWAQKSWNGKYSSSDSKTWSTNPYLQKELGYSPSLHQDTDDGIFWIAWEDILIYFQNLHLSWNPALFSCRTTLHRSWPASMGPKDDSFNIGDNPQFILTVDDEAIRKKASIWILLSRHVTKQEQESSNATQFLSLHINRNSKAQERLYYPRENRLITGAYLNNPHVLLRYDVTAPNDKYLTIVLSQYRKSKDLNYTLSCFCTSPFRIGPPNELPFKHEIASEWTKETAGGPPMSAAKFCTNPMWKITIPEGGSNVQLQCRAVKTIATNIMVFKGVPTRKREIVKMARSKVIDSGAYRPGFVVTRVHFIQSSGDYTVVINSFEPGQVGNFVLTLSSSEKLLIEMID